MRLLPLCIVSFLLGCCLLGAAQQMPQGAPLPPITGPAPDIPPITNDVPRHAVARVDPSALQREAKELLDLSQSVQPDIQALRRGLMAKDLADRLKRIEKLSKQLRNEIAPLAK
jgi:hypothetical protein